MSKYSKLVEKALKDEVFAAKLLEQNGFEDAVSLRGGYAAWIANET